MLVMQGQVVGMEASSFLVVGRVHLGVVGIGVDQARPWFQDLRLVVEALGVALLPFSYCM